MANPRYRCPFCGSFSADQAVLVREHLFKRHEAALRMRLKPIEAYPTPKEGTD